MAQFSNHKLRELGVATVLTTQLICRSTCIYRTAGKVCGTEIMAICMDLPATI